MGKVTVTEHPLIQHKLTLLREASTSSKDFRELLTEITMLMGYELTRNLPIQDKLIETPMGPATGKEMAGKKPCIVPVLRAGLGMVGHIGLYRDPKTLEPVEYYCKLPKDVKDREVIVVDPMLATGGSLSAAVDFIKQRGATKIRALCLLAAPEGLEAFQKAHPDVDLYVSCIDEKLDEHAYIVPGLGDAGDRIFGTK